MKQYMKKNKILIILTALTIIFIIIGIFIPSVLPKSINKEIEQNIKNLILRIKEKKQIDNSPSITYIGNILTILIIWSLGISIIGIPILLLYYSIKSLYISLETILLLKNIKSCNILFIIIYSIPSIINLVLLFIIIYYACNYSIILIKTLFLKKDYSIKRITLNYIKILIVMIVITSISTIIEIIIPKLLSNII